MTRRVTEIFADTSSMKGPPLAESFSKTDEVPVGIGVEPEVLESAAAHVGVQVAGS